MSLQDLDAGHLTPLRLALANMLSTPVAEFTYAQIVDGMPVSSVYAEDHWFQEDFPVMQHDELCPGALEKTRALRADFDVLSLSLDPQAIQAYQNTVPGSLPWKLRLLELVVTGCHNIASSLYLMDNGTHKHAEWTTWREKKLATLPEHCSKRERSKCGPPTLFYANQYMDPQRFPHGLADVAGYWAELRIFGGVVLFDRGLSEDECNGMYLHSSKPATLAPPTENQFKSLIGFLLSPEPDLACSPLPISISKENRWRWNAYDALTEHHIFKNPYEIPIEETFRRYDCTFRPSDWPEMDDYEVGSLELRKKEAGQPYDEDLLKTTWERLARTITPTSRYWNELEGEIVRIQPDRKKQGRPPYFFDD
ncbi:hypothetical protein F5883DRAFT_130470 [Diaporthe sp. PMI_573]|nr:hypothetical protein F5883DRAFT_130470 [Diaporthaceae sp. PMI_573]